MKILGIIPARYGSTRLEGKPLLDIGGKTMIQRVYERCRSCSELSEIIVATDDERIAQHCEDLNIPVMVTSERHINGTERCSEVVSRISENYDLIINIQGDEPFIHPKSISDLIHIFQIHSNAEIGTLKKSIQNTNELILESIIKIITRKDGRAIYFSRQIIPYQREVEKAEFSENFSYHKHIGIYAFRPEVLKKIVLLEPSSLESAEKLEQLRWIENGYDIYVNETEYESKSVDTREDYEYLLKNFHQYE